jgi:hypothetical protein
MGCLNKWSTIRFTDGTVVQVYLTSINFTNAAGFVPHNIATVTCDGSVIQNTQHAQTCLNKWVQVQLPNGVRLSMYMTSYDDNYIGGSMQTSELLGLSGQIAGIEC